jgi:hypothetical protein
MSNAGKKMINWKKDFPVLRVALGLLGERGYTSMHAARIILADPCTSDLRVFCKKELGRELNDETIQSRLKRVTELGWFKENDPRSYRKGGLLRDELQVKLKKSGITPYGALV